jgi:glycerophosphoryl diester phosphodiesterase
MGFTESSVPLLLAHRGGAGIYPENTIYAFEQSVTKHRADVVELDIHTTRDGELVVIHDDTVDRTTDGTGRVDSLYMDEIRELDAGYRFTADGGRTYPYRGKGLRIPALREVFEAFRGNDTGINIEIKKSTPNIERKLYNLITGMGMTKRVLVNSGHPLVMVRFRRINKQGVLTGADSLQVALAYALANTGLSQLFSSNDYAFQVPLIFRGVLRIVTPSLVKLCKEKGIKLHVWTINEVSDMQSLVATGVDGIITDYPDRLRKLLNGI